MNLSFLITMAMFFFGYIGFFSLVMYLFFSGYIGFFPLLILSILFYTGILPMLMERFRAVITPAIARY